MVSYVDQMTGYVLNFANPAELAILQKADRPILYNTKKYVTRIGNMKRPKKSSSCQLRRLLSGKEVHLGPSKGIS